MTGNRIAFVSAIGFAVLALFMFSGAEAEDPKLHIPFQSPEAQDVRVDGIQPMIHGITFESNDWVEPFSLVVEFESGTADSIALECSHGDCGTTPDGFWRVPAISEPAASALVANVGGDVIRYQFVASKTGENTVCQPSPCDTFQTNNTRVNTVPVLTDNASVAGGGMPEDTYTLTITYTDADSHLGMVTATVCETSSPTNCDDPDLTLLKTSGDDDSGAVYSVDFNTELGGSLTVTVSATDGHDPAADDRTTTFAVDTTTPWLKHSAVSNSSAGEGDDVTFTTVFCVFDTGGGGTPSVSVDVGSATHAMSDTGDSNSDCKNGVNYTVTTTVAWAATAQDIIFWGSNDNGDAGDIEGLSITINDAPTLTNGTAERHFNGDDFVFNVSAADINSGDSLTVYAVIEFDDVSEREMTTCIAGSFSLTNCTLTVAESVIIDQRGGLRVVTFRVQDIHTTSTAVDFTNSIDVTKTSSFTLTGPGDKTPQPGLTDDYTFTIVNNGNFEDTFDIAASSLNDWIHASSDPSVIVPHISSGTNEGTFEIVMDVPHVAAGTTDSWTVIVTAGHNDTQTDGDSGTTTVDVVSTHTVTIADASSSADPGATATYYFTITNTGNADESFTYTTNGNPGSDSPTESLGMGESETIAVSHTVSGAPGSTFTVTFAATGISGSESETATTTTNQIYDLSVSQSGGNEPVGSLKPGHTFQIEYTITNDGNGATVVIVSFHGDWLSGNQDTTVSVPAGGTDTVTVSVSVPSSAPSGSSSSVSISVTGDGDSDESSYIVNVAASTRAVSLSGTGAYTINEGDSQEGTVTVMNDGVYATFAVTSSDSNLSFDTTEITLGTGASGTMTFTIHATADGTFSFTVTDTIDGSSDDFTVTVDARVFEDGTDIATYGTNDCGSSSGGVTVTCTPDPDGGWDGTKYKNAGTWSTAMVVTDSNGQSGARTLSTTIANAAPAVSPISADGGTAGNEQTFTFTVPSDSDGDITHFVIDFGDGNSQTFGSSDLEGTTVTATHTYESAGDFSVTATAYDNSGGETMKAVTISVGERTVTLDDNSYIYNLIALLGFFVLGILLAGTAFRMQQGEIAGDEEMNERDRQRLESVERRMESLAEREELLEVSAYDASRAATKLEEHISAFNEVLVRAQEIAAEEKLRELEVAEETRNKEDEQMQLDLEDPDIEMVAERFHDSLSRLVKARDELSKIEEQLAHILKMERDEQLEKLTSMTESYESTKRKIDALQSTKEARDAAAAESNIMNMLSAAASGAGAADFGDFGDFGDDADEYEVEIYEDEDGSFYYIDPDTGEETPCDEDGNAL